MNFEAFINDINSNNWNVFGMEVYAGSILLHAWGDTSRRHPIYSATKTITSIAAGMAIDDGKLDIDAPVLDLMPAAALSKMNASQQEAYRRITLERLLTMSITGYPFRPEGESWLDFSLAIPLPDPEHREFHYSNISAYLAGVAVANALGCDLYEFLSERLFAPLGIHNPPYARCPNGYFYGASSMELSVNELSRIGLLLKQGGMYGGKRLLSENYVKAATSAQQTNREGGYGYFIWKYRNGFSINGKWKQKCYVLPDPDLMVTFLSRMVDEGDGLIRSMERHILDI